jgi:hypothetical protein
MPGPRSMVVSWARLCLAHSRTGACTSAPALAYSRSFGKPVCWSQTLYLDTASTTSVWVEGENLEVDPPRRLVQTMTALWSDDVKNEGTSRVTWEIEPVGDSCRLTVIHDQLREGANDELYGGWPMILSGLKTLLETGELLTTPGSLRFSESSSDQAA